MNSRTTDHLVPAIGDILLLVSRNKLRKPNTAYQSAARRKIAAYSHVAIVFSPYSIIDATPNDGVAIRRWDVISQQYDIERSMVIRHRRLASSQEKQVHLLGRMQYYYAQPYSLTALLRKKRKFRDGEGLVCSQFVAAVFEEAGFPASGVSPRKTLPIDIDVHTCQALRWSRFGMAGYRLRNSPTDSNPITAELNNTFSLLDEYFAKSTMDNITLSKAGLLLNMLGQLAVKEFESDRMTEEDMAKLCYRSKRGDFRLSAGEFISGWRRSFIEPEHPPLFLHEESFGERELRKGFVRSCEKLLNYVEVVSPQQDKLIDEGIEKAKTICILLSKCAIGGVDYADLLHGLIEVRKYLEQLIDNKECVFAQEEPEAITRRISGYPDLIDELKNNPSADLDSAFLCLKAIWLFDLAHEQWIDFRKIVSQFLRSIDSVIAVTSSIETSLPS